MSSFRFTRLKILIGYVLLLAILSLALHYIYKEVEMLSAVDNSENLRTDSLMTLLQEKDKNTLRMLRVLSEMNDTLLATSQVEETVSVQDTVVTLQRIQRHVVTTNDTVMAPPEKKGFFKRLAEAFVPSKRDSTVLVNRSTSTATDTLIAPAQASLDSLREKRKLESEQIRQQRQQRIRRTRTRYQRVNNQLTAQMDSLIHGYEVEMSQRAEQDAENQQALRMRSVRTIAGIAIGAVLLSAIFLILIWHDITRSNRYRRQLEQANRRAEELLAAREKMILAITHDFKAPLGSIMGYIDLLMPLTHEAKPLFYLHNMKSSSQHLLKLVQDLLDFHRLDLNKEEAHIEPFNPSLLFDEIRVSFEPLTAAKGLYLHFDIAPELNGKYASDPLRLRQIVTNLLSNAVKFTPQGGISVTATYHYSRLSLDVADTGMGMRPEDRERIFRAFTRLPGAQGEEGFGLGLSIVRKLVDLLGGSISVDSTPDEGSCFSVVLPLRRLGNADPVSEPSDTATDAAADSPSLPSGKTLRILMIDDDKIQLRLTESMLARANIQTVACEQVDQLLDCLRSDTFDLLLTDIQMPALNGFDLLKLLRASNIPQARTIPVVAVTARSEMEESSLSEHGFSGVLHKPFTAKELLAVVCGQAPSQESQESDAPRELDFGALTAYSSDDAEAAHQILVSFVTESQKNLERMRNALAQNDAAGVTAMAHKMLPLFTLIKADEAVSGLRWLEEHRNVPADGEFCARTRQTISALADVLARAESLY